MPTYSYRCTECGTAFDIHQAFTDDSLTVCPACGGKLRKLFSAVGVTSTAPASTATTRARPRRSPGRRSLSRVAIRARRVRLVVDLASPAAVPSGASRRPPRRLQPQSSLDRPRAHAPTEIRLCKGFREFILRGNVIDLAVAVVIGAAFTAIVNAIVTGVINPSSARCSTPIAGEGAPGDDPPVSAGTATMHFGAVIAALLQFLLVAVVRLLRARRADELGSGLARSRRAAARPRTEDTSCASRSATCSDRDRNLPSPRRHAESAPTRYRHALRT